MTDSIESLIQNFHQNLQVAIQAQIQTELQGMLSGLMNGGKVMQSGLKLRIAKGKRTPEAMEDTKTRILTTLKEEPDLRSEQMQKILKLSGNDLALPLRQLLEEKKVVCKGVARGRTYRVK